MSYFYHCFETKKQFSVPSVSVSFSLFKSKINLLFLCCSCLLGGLQAQSYTVATDRANANYTVGENITFKVTSSIDATAEYEIMLDKHTSAVARGTLELRAGMVSEIPFSTTDPSVVLCRVRTAGMMQQAGAAISPFELFPIEEEPARFDAFWEEARTELATIPIDPQLTLVEEADSEYSTTYRINIATIDGRRVYGYISVPKMEGPYPGVITLPAYGSIANVVKPTKYLAEQAGVLAMSISIHNTEPDVVDPNSYKPNNIMNEYTNYYRYAVLACIRAIDYMFLRSDFTGELAVTGVSQGGGLALMTAGLDKRVDLLVYSNASHCEHAGKKYEKASGFPYYLNQARLMYNIDAEDEEQIVQACKYYDASYFAHRYTGPSLGFISYLDDVSPPTTTFAAFNQLQGQKILMHGKILKHEHPQEYWVGRYDALRRFLPNSIRAPWPYARKTKGYFIDIGENETIARGEQLTLTPTLIKHEENIVLPAKWKQLEGPSPVTFSSPNSLNTTVNFSEAGTYKLEVRVQDETLLAEGEKFYSISDEITVIVYDDIAPLLIDCPEDITVYTSTRSKVVEWEEPSLISTCNETAVTIEQTKGQTSGSSIPVGRMPIEYTITDACGQMTTCTFYVTILKETVTPLNVDCPEDVLIYTDNTSAIGNWNLPRVVSACNSTPTIYTQTGGLPLGSSFPLGNTRISYRIEDACGQETECSFLVTILQEVDALQIACPENISITTEDTSATVTWELPEVLSACNEESVQYTEVQGFESNTNFPVGDTQVTYQVLDACGQETECSFTITVIQELRPLEIACPDDIMLVTEGTSALADWELPEIISACNEESVRYTEMQGFEPNTDFPVGDTQIAYQVIDACGQERTCSFTITVVQELRPLEIACPNDIMLETELTSVIANWELPEIVSACNEESVQYTQIEGLERNTAFPLGETLVTYDVLDACGQQTTCSFTVFVMQNIMPLAISCPNDTTLFTYSDNALPNWNLPEILSACMNTGIQYIQRAGPQLGNPFPLGATEVRYEVMDACGQITTCAFVITVEQLEQPPLEITCPEDINLLTTTGSAEVSWELPEVLSSCGEGLQFMQTEGPVLGSLFRIGTSRISYEVMDACGQTTTCSFVVEVMDDSPPLLNISCPFNITAYTYAQDTIVNWELPEIGSACDDSGVSYDQVAGFPRGGVFPLGNTRVTYKIQDACEQTKYCSFIVTVIKRNGETLAVECPEDITMVLPFGVSTSPVHWSMPTATSICSGNIVISQIQGPPSGSSLVAGMSTITYIIQDACENRMICSFNVKIVARKDKAPDDDEINLASTSPKRVDVTAYPNPTREQLTIVWQSIKEEQLSIELINPLGQVLYQRQLQAVAGRNDTNIPMVHLSNGWYVWRLKNAENWVVTQQILKQ